MFNFNFDLNEVKIPDFLRFCVKLALFSFGDTVEPIILLKAIHQSTPLTLNPLRLSTTQASSASLPTVTVTFGIGSANLGNDVSAVKKHNESLKRQIKQN